MTIILRLEPGNVFTRASDGKVVFTYSDLETLGEFPEVPVVEIIGGDLFMAPSPTVIHQAISGDLTHVLKSHVKSNDLGIILNAPVDVVFSERDVCVPDIVFISRDRKDLVTRKFINGPPDLIVEILTTNRDLDLVTKKAIYEKYGVREYWIVDPEQRKVLVHLLAGDSRVFHPPVVYSPGDNVPVASMPSLVVKVEDIFKSM